MGHALNNPADAIEKKSLVSIKIEPWLSVAMCAAVRDGHEHLIHPLRAPLVIAMNSSN